MKEFRFKRVQVTACPHVPQQTHEITATPIPDSPPTCSTRMRSAASNTLSRETAASPRTSTLGVEAGLEWLQPRPRSFLGSCPVRHSAIWASIELHTVKQLPLSIYSGKGTVVCPIHKCRVACGYIAVLPHTLVTKRYITHVLRWVSWVIHVSPSPGSPSSVHALIFVDL